MGDPDLVGTEQYDSCTIANEVYDMARVTDDKDNLCIKKEKEHKRIRDMKEKETKKRRTCVEMRGCEKETFQ